MVSDVWAGTFGPRDASIVVVGEAWGKEEAEAGRPFVGPSGNLLGEMLAETGLRREDCFLTNVVNARPPGNDLQQWFEVGDSTVAGLRPGPEVRAGVSALFQQLDAIKPKVVLAFGNYALWALTRHAGSAPDGPRPRTPSGILDWRGSQVYRVRSGLDREPGVGSGVDTDTPVLPLVHPDDIRKVWALRVPTIHDLRIRVPLALATAWRAVDRAPPVQLRALTDFIDADAALFALKFHADQAQKRGATLDLVCDIETARSTLITCVGIAHSDSAAVSLPFVKLGALKGTFTSFWKPAQEASLLRSLGALFRHPAVGWIGQNFLYDRAFLWEWFRIEPRVTWDTLSAQNLLLPGTPKDLGYLSSLYCRHHIFWKADNREWATDDAKGLEVHLLYNAEDCARTFEVAMEQRRALAEVEPDRSEHSEGRLALWPDELDAIDFAWEMQRRGMRVDQERRARLALDLMEARNALAQWLETVVPQSVLDAEGVTPKSGTRWYSSPRQTAVLLYEVLGLRVQRDRKTGSVSTADEAIGTLKEAYPRLGGIFEALLEYRSIQVLFSTFVEAKLEVDGRFRASFNPAGTSTFRFSSSKNPFRRGGNMQNLPQGEED